MLVHQSTVFPLPLNELSRWLERHVDPLDRVLAAYEAQPYRRIIKTHTPLDGLPYFEQASYVFCGRDPRDVFLSGLDHVRNASEKTVTDARRRAGIPEDSQFPDDPNVTFSLWLTTGAMEGMEDGFPTGSVIVPHRHLLALPGTCRTYISSTAPTCPPISTERCAG